MSTPVARCGAQGEQWRERAAAKEITIDVRRLCLGHCRRCRRRRAGAIINNLLSNAVGYTPRGGRVTLKTTCSDGLVTISVADNGPGVEKADLARILQPFEQALTDGAIIRMAPVSVSR